jgi:aspartyl-tRNA(Asn)/glutamyl-tRNA(Gln) amidotransferase subunit C
VITREEVLHVARLARLQLSEDEVLAMTADLARVLEHVEMISTLDLEGVPPTSHVVEVENALREDVPIPCLPRDVVLAAAPEAVDDGFAVPSPQAGGDG